MRKQITIRTTDKQHPVSRLTVRHFSAECLTIGSQTGGSGLHTILIPKAQIAELITALRELSE